MADSAGGADGRLADNIVHFARILRGAGLPVGPAQAMGALEALQAAGIGRRQDFYWTLHATLVTRHEHKPIFDQAFELFWRRRGLLDKMLTLESPEMTSAAEEAVKPMPAALRLAEALGEGREPPPRREEKIEIDARLSMSEREILRTKDFEQMSAAEFAEAQRLARAVVLPEDQVPTRRMKPHARGRRLDPHGTLRRTLRTGGDVIALARRAPKFRHPPLVLLVDISGSMAAYSRAMLHFAYALARARERVHVFLFGTRLTNVTRHLRTRDPDEALTRISQAVEDWSGGTRIASCLTAFNKHWSRRVLGSGAVVLMVTDGLEREAGDELPRQMERLRKSCRRLIWLNPLLRFDRFEARAGGIRAMLPHVDEFRPVHNLESLASLVEALDGRRRFLPDPKAWLKPAA